jgi:hypothetical protein
VITLIPRRHGRGGKSFPESPEGEELEENQPELGQEGNIGDNQDYIEENVIRLLSNLTKIQDEANQRHA